MPSAVKDALELLGITHDPLKDPILWNEQWERNIRDRALLSRMIDPSPLDEATKQYLLSNHRARLGSLPSMFYMVLEAASTRTLDFSDRWLGTTALDR